MPPKRKKTVIPNLTPDLYRCESRNTAAVPKQITATVQEDGRFDFEWRAKGSSNVTYGISACGKLDARKSVQVRWKDMQVHCSCPNFDDQDLATEETGWRILFVCKHLKAALDSVCDNQEKSKPCAAKKNKAKPNQQAAIASTQDDNDDDDKEKDDERTRIEQGLSQLSNQQVLDLLRQRLSTEDGLMALSLLFPPDVLPPQPSRAGRRIKRKLPPS